MKKLLTLCLTIAVCLAVAAADAARMTVVNCSQWVSLRETPDSSSRRLAKVFLGEVLEDCRPADNGFYACSYGEKQGYIKAEYLQQERQTESGFDGLSELPACRELKKIGETVLDASEGGYRVVAQRAWKDEYEEILAVCYDRNLKPLWKVREVSPEAAAELPATGAFFAGSRNSPALIVFVAGKGFSAYTLGRQKAERWTLETDAVGGGMTGTAADDGTVYAIGYYDVEPVCISDEGSLLWKGVNDDPSCYWPYRLEADTNGVSVTYDTGSVLYFSKDGDHQGIPSAE